MQNLKTFHIENTKGIVVCGGASSRMGKDKSMLKYYEKPQRYHVYKMLVPFCEEVYISCNAAQVETIDTGYKLLTDIETYNNTGPMGALLSAFNNFPHQNILFIGCDYPYLTGIELTNFSKLCKTEPVAFFNKKENMYEPLLAWYPASTAKPLNKMWQASRFSLQHFLKEVNAVKYYPAAVKSIVSVDTYADYLEALQIIKK